MTAEERKPSALEGRAPAVALSRPKREPGSLDRRHATITLLDTAPMSYDLGSEDSGEMLDLARFCA